MSRMLAFIFLLHPLVCFGAEIALEDSITDKITKHPNWNLINSEECGRSNADRIIGGTDAPIGAYPWLARIGYTSMLDRRTPRLIDYECAGTVINKFYILTAAHCVEHVFFFMVPSSIRLGEHNVRSNPDCDDNLCNDPYQDRDIAEIIVHGDYNAESSKNDIALVRVNKAINFTDFVRPICLPSGKLLEKDLTGQTVDVAGWGIYDIADLRQSDILQTVKLPVIDLSRCIIHYHEKSVDSRQLCIGGQVGKDSCSGDSGGPVTMIETEYDKESPRYLVVGIVSYGPTDCGEKDIPAVYTKVSNYTHWILDHLKQPVE